MHKHFSAKREKEQCWKCQKNSLCLHLFHRTCATFSVHTQNLSLCFPSEIFNAKKLQRAIKKRKVANSQSCPHNVTHNIASLFLRFWDTRELFFAQRQKIYVFMVIIAVVSSPPSSLLRWHTKNENQNELHSRINSKGLHCCQKKLLYSSAQHRMKTKCFLPLLVLTYSDSQRRRRNYFYFLDIHILYPPWRGAYIRRKYSRIAVYMRKSE